MLVEHCELAFCRVFETDLAVFIWLCDVVRPVLVTAVYVTIPSALCLFICVHKFSAASSSVVGPLC